MVWFFGRGTDTAMVEVRRRDAHFEVVVRRPESPEMIHIAHRPVDVFEHLEAAPRSLIAEGWQWQPRDPLLMLLAPPSPQRRAVLATR